MAIGALAPIEGVTDDELARQANDPRVPPLMRLQAQQELAGRQGGPVTGALPVTGQGPVTGALPPAPASPQGALSGVSPAERRGALDPHDESIDDQVLTDFYFDTQRPDFAQNTPQRTRVLGVPITGPNSLGDMIGGSAAEIGRGLGGRGGEMVGAGLDTVGNWANDMITGRTITGALSQGYDDLFLRPLRERRQGALEAFERGRDEREGLRRAGAFDALDPGVQGVPGGSARTGGPSPAAAPALAGVVPEPSGPPGALSALPTRDVGYAPGMQPGGALQGALPTATPATEQEQGEQILNSAGPLEREVIEQEAEEAGMPAWRVALLAAGLQMMASNSPNPLSALGEGGLAGLRAFQGIQRQRAEDRRDEDERQWRRDYRSGQLALQQATHELNATLGGARLDLATRADARAEQAHTAQLAEAARQRDLAAQQRTAFGDLLFSGEQAGEFGGLNPQYLPMLEGNESGGDPTARNARSGALGLHQYMPSVWAEVRQAIPGLPATPDQATPQQSRQATAWLTERNARHMAPILGRMPNLTEGYMGHGLGAHGAATVLTGNPNNTVLATLGDILTPRELEKWIEDNPLWFYDGNSERTNAGLHDLFESRVAQRGADPMAPLYGPAETAGALAHLTPAQIEQARRAYSIGAFDTVRDLYVGGSGGNENWETLRVYNPSTGQNEYYRMNEDTGEYRPTNLRVAETDNFGRYLTLARQIATDPIYGTMIGTGGEPMSADSLVGLAFEIEAAVRRGYSEADIAANPDLLSQVQPNQQTAPRGIVPIE